MSEKTRFQGTEKDLFERGQLHLLVDFFWKNMDYKRTQVYDLMAKVLHSPEPVHISDMGHDQMKKVAEAFQAILAANGVAPCRNCEYAGEATSLGLFPCTHKGSKGYFWLDPENEIQPRRCSYATTKR